MTAVNKYQIGQEVIVVVGNKLGVIEDVGYFDSTRTKYFVCVQEWDEGTNGGRWLGESSLKDKSS
jgi:hypothetical protein